MVKVIHLLCLSERVVILKLISYPQAKAKAIVAIYFKIIG